MECHPPADDVRKELLRAVVPNPPRVVPDGLTAGVVARGLLVNAADCAGLAGGVPAKAAVGAAFAVGVLVDEEPLKKPGMK
jgi:hypothetical protein